MKRRTFHLLGSEGHIKRNWYGTSKKIIAILKLQGLQKVCSGITQPNHKSNGWTP